MPEPKDLNINLNQNVWGLIVSLLTLGASEYFKLPTLHWFGIILSVISTLSFVATLCVYTWNYIKKKSK